MINSNLYDYVNVLNKAADASFLKNTAISNNIANSDTPGYKRQDVDFEGVLSQELGKSKYVSLDSKIKGVSLEHLNVGTYTDSEGYSYRLDGNNVDPDTENVELASNQIKYRMMIDSMGQEFSRIKTAMS